ncbi:MAG: hypothetical protein ABIN94_14230 [Ferruginibacter sp.]
MIKNALYQSVIWRGLFYLTVFLLNVFIARHYGAVQSGAIYYIISIYSLVLLGTGLSIESGITYFVSKGEIDAGKILGFSIVWAFFIGLIAFVTVWFYFPKYHQLPGDVMLFSAFTFICGNLLLNYCTGFFYARNDFMVPNSINVVINVVLILLLPNQKFSIFNFVTDEQYLYCYFGSFLLQGIILAIVVKIKYLKFQLPKLLSLSEFKALLMYCLLAYASNLVFFFLYRIDYWFVEQFCSAEDLGNYIQVSKIGQLFFVLPTILASAIFPLTARGGEHLLKELLVVLSRSLLWLYAVACFFLILFGNQLFLFVFGKSFTKMYHAFLFLVPGILSLSMLFTLTAYYAGKNKISINIAGALLALLFVITGDCFLIPKYGINAAALVSSLGYFIYLIFVLHKFVIEHDLPWSSFFIIRLADINRLYSKLKNETKPLNEL